MKNLFKYVAFALLSMAVVALPSCNDDDTETSVVLTLEVAEAEDGLAAPAAGTDNLTLTINANVDWTADVTYATEGEDWVHLSALSGTPSLKNVTVTVDANDALEPREATIVVSSSTVGVESVEVKVSQSAADVPPAPVVAPNTLVYGDQVYEFNSVVAVNEYGNNQIVFAIDEGIDSKDALYASETENGYGWVNYDPEVKDTEVDMLADYTWSVLFNNFGEEFPYMIGQYVDEGITSAVAKLTEVDGNIVFTMDAVVAGVTVKLNLTCAPYIPPVYDYTLTDGGTAIVYADYMGEGWPMILIGPGSYSSMDNLYMSGDWFYNIIASEAIMDGQPRDLATLQPMNWDTEPYTGDLYCLRVEDYNNYDAPLFQPDSEDYLDATGTMTLTLDKANMLLTVEIDGVISGTEVKVSYNSTYIDAMAGQGGGGDVVNWMALNGEELLMGSQYHENLGDVMGMGTDMHMFCFSPTPGLTNPGDFQTPEMLGEDYGLVFMCTTNAMAGEEINLANITDQTVIYQIMLYLNDGSIASFVPGYSAPATGSLYIEPGLNGEFYLNGVLDLECVTGATPVTYNVEFEYTGDFGASDIGGGGAPALGEGIFENETDAIDIVGCYVYDTGEAYQLLFTSTIPTSIQEIMLNTVFQITLSYEVFESLAGAENVSLTPETDGVVIEGVAFDYDEYDFVYTPYGGEVYVYSCTMDAQGFSISLGATDEDGTYFMVYAGAFEDAMMVGGGGIAPWAAK